MLVKCGECGGQMSTTAVACPHCGHRVQTEGERKNIRLTFFLLAILFTVMGTMIVVQISRRAQERAVQQATQR